MLFCPGSQPHWYRPHHRPVETDLLCREEETTHPFLRLRLPGLGLGGPGEGRLGCEVFCPGRGGNARVSVIREEPRAVRGQDWLPQLCPQRGWLCGGGERPGDSGAEANVRQPLQSPGHHHRESPGPGGQEGTVEAPAELHGGANTTGEAAAQAAAGGAGARQGLVRPHLSDWDVLVLRPHQGAGRPPGQAARLHHPQQWQDLSVWPQQQQHPALCFSAGWTLCYVILLFIPSLSHFKENLRGK